MEKLLPYYERELVFLRRNSRAFAERYPRIAGQLSMAGDTCSDPQIEHMNQAFAMMAGRIAKRLDDHYPQFTESLLETLYPHYLRPFPSCSIVKIDSPAGGDSRASAILPRGTSMRSKPVKEVRCQFRSTADVVMSAVALETVKFSPIIDAPANIRLPPGAGAAIGITVVAHDKDGLQPFKHGKLRLFIDGETSFCAAVRDTLLMRASAAYVEAADGGGWSGMQQVPISAAGFSDEESLIPFSSRSNPAYRLLTEYFAFPEKFNFIDIDLQSIAARLPDKCMRCTLHLAIRSVRPDSDLARTLKGLSAQNLQLHCTPVVNLFRKAGTPVQITHAAPDYSLIADGPHPQAYEIHTVESALLVDEGKQNGAVDELKPFYSSRHGQGDPAGSRYWVTRRDDITAELSPGHELRIALVDEGLEALPVSAQTLSLEFTCTNRDLPAELSFGSREGDLTVAGVSSSIVARFMRKPCPSYRFAVDKGAHWRLISHLSLNHQSLSGVGLEQFRQMLTLYDLPQSPVNRRQIQGIVGLDYKVIMAWIPGEPCAALMPGIEIRMTLDEEAFVGSGIHLFAQVADHFFGLYCQINVFSQLLVVSQRTGEELLKCPPRSGASALA
ncbi:type VI secretion system baseplate subunit TssF [Oxalobacteraceae bacterium]|nr:type VI secretion system baseplate subunit TssF [Oxalobacteraceae bacterium]